MQNYAVMSQIRKTVSCLPSSKREASKTGKNSSSQGSSSTKRKSVSKKAPRILLVEDERINRLVFGTFLTSMGFNVVFAENGASALAENLEDYALVLLDIGLPDMLGIEVCQKMRAKEKTKMKTPIVFFTAFDISQKREACLAAGGTDVLQKPMSEEQLKEHLSAWLPEKLKKNK